MQANRRESVRTALRVLLAAFFVFAGVMHFAASGTYVRIMPAYLPAPLALVYVSGICEILGGIGVLFPPPLRRWAGWGLIALLVAVFPANVDMALHGAVIGHTNIQSLWLWMRLPLQFVLMAWVAFAAQLRRQAP